MLGCCVDRACTPETCMNLPAGMTCGQCVHLDRCTKIYGHKPEDTVCDWFPRKFRLREAAPEDKEEGA